MAVGFKLTVADMAWPCSQQPAVLLFLLLVALDASDQGMYVREDFVSLLFLTVCYPVRSIPTHGEPAIWSKIKSPFTFCNSQMRWAEGQAWSVPLANPRSNWQAARANGASPRKQSVRRQLVGHHQQLDCSLQCFPARPLHHLGKDA
jgi:hypothetical protein